jgi:hypothetical protein
MFPIRLHLRIVGYIQNRWRPRSARLRPSGPNTLRRVLHNCSEIHFETNATAFWTPKPPPLPSAVFASSRLSSMTGCGMGMCKSPSPIIIPPPTPLAPLIVATWFSVMVLPLMVGEDPMQAIPPPRRFPSTEVPLPTVIESRARRLRLTVTNNKASLMRSVEWLIPASMRFARRCLA